MRKSKSSFLIESFPPLVMFYQTAFATLAERRDLVASAALQNLDQDIFFDQWLPPPGLFDKSIMKGLPQHGIGRACKVGNEQVVGLLVALKSFAESSVEDLHQKYLKTLETMVE